MESWHLTASNGKDSVGGSLLTALLKYKPVSLNSMNLQFEMKRVGGRLRNKCLWMSEVGE